MAHALKLPGLKPGTAASLAGNAALAEPRTNAARHLGEAIRALETPEQPGLVLGSETTPTVYWLAALHCFPDAIKLIHTPEGWINLDTGERVEVVAPEPELKPEARPEPKPEPPPEAEPEPEVEPELKPETRPEPEQKTHDPRQMKGPNLIGQGFFYATWGPHDTAGQRNLQALRAEVLRRRSTSPRLASAFEKAVENGYRAFQLAEDAKKRLERGQNRQDIDAWLRRQTRGLHESVYKKAIARLDKHQRWVAGRRKASRVQTSTLKPLRFTGPHPNSLPHLPPTDHWTFYVDETGSQFRVAEPGKAGRVVTVAVPDYTVLPELPPGAHGTEDSPKALDKRVRTLLEHQVGVFGFTVTDARIASGSWISGISDLVRWAALQTPVKGHAPRFNFVIEQQEYQDTNQLRALAETLEDRLHALRPETLGNLRITLTVCAKRDDTRLAYADAVAFTWGGTVPATKDRLRKTRWIGHCLLNQDTQSALRLLLALDERYRLLPQEWYGLFADASQDGLRTQVGEYLDTLGERVRKAPHLWRSYLAEVQHRLARKDYTPASLAEAMAWLDRFAPAGTALPPRAKLNWLSARVAADNHQGIANPEAATRLAELANLLLDEAPDDAVQAMLRVVVSGTNAFEFAGMETQARHWLEAWHARIGRLNRGKLQSTLGQLAAFQGREAEAIGWFDQALDTFAGLSDPEEAAREAGQTRIYRLIAEMDSVQEDAERSRRLETLGQHLAGLTQRPDATLADAADRVRKQVSGMSGGTLPAEQVALLAISGPDWRFAHHLLLRTLVMWPETTAEARDICLAVQDDWQTDIGHPWPLIQAYRAALLYHAGQTDNAALRMQDALGALDDAPEGSVLAWMRDALQIWGCALGVLESRPDPQHLGRWANLLPSAPWQAMQRWAGEDLAPGSAPAILRTLLPFNFH